MTDALDVLFPPGRLVQGNLYEPNKTDANGQPLLVKTGPNKGQPRVDYFFAVAIPKTPGVTHWANETHANPTIGAWGLKIWNFAHQAWPNGQTQRPDFAWKIVDGDSQVPNKKGVKPCDMVGHKGHWIIKFGGGFQPKIVTADGMQTILEPNAVKPGYFVQVFANVSSNNSDQTAGIYINHRIVAMAGYGEEIMFGPDPTQVGFGGAPLPPGASSVPLGNMTPPAAGAGAPPPVAHSAPPGVASPPAPGAGAAANPPPPPGAAQAAPPPNPAFTQAAAGAPPPPGAASVPQRVMLPAAGGVTYEAYIAAGWNDQQLIQQGKMAP